MCDDSEATVDEVIEARMLYASDEIEIDEEPAVSRIDDGVWVAAWVWLAKPVKEEEKPKPDITKTILTLAVPSTLDACRPDQVDNWWNAYISARGG